MASCRARAFRELCLHMREKRNYPPRVAWRIRFRAWLEAEPASDSAKRSRFCTPAKLLDGIERPLPRIQIHNHERIRIGRGRFQELLARRRYLQRDSSQFCCFEELRLKKKIID
jgi:hypothetical protein